MNDLSLLAKTFTDHLTAMPLIAILRGIRPDEVAPVGRALIDAGIRIIEIPLNSPKPFESIERLAAEAGDAALVGAGTVLDIADIARVKAAGGQLVVSPNCNTDVIAATVEAGMISIPGYFTPTEAFAAIVAGAHAIKLFPAEAASPAVVKAQRAVLPRNVPLLVVGGVQVSDVGNWVAAGASGFGLGGALYKPGQSAAQVHQQAKAFVDQLQKRSAS